MPESIDIQVINLKLTKTNKTMNQNQKPNYTFALIVVIAVCFLIGFVTTMNNSMIAFCKSTFNLSDTQGQFVNSAFYGMYVFSILLGMLMNKIGYKKTMIGGLAVVALGFLFCYFGINSYADGASGMIEVPSDEVAAKALTTSVFYTFLMCMACVAIGIVMLQLVANPYVMVLGSPERGAFRMTISQAINSVATVFAPMFVSGIILGNSTSPEEEAALDNLKAKLAEDPNLSYANPTQATESLAAQIDPSSITTPFLGLCIFVAALCLILAFLKLPEIKEGEQSFDKNITYKSSVFKYPHVWLCALAICFYMGLEIGVPSMIPAKMQSLYPNVGDQWITKIATGYLAFYWAGMMVGRFAGSWILGKFQPRTVLSTCLIAGAACIGISFILPGMSGVYAMLLAGLFHSVMWPLIFNLGLQELGPHTKAGSGVINMGVIGGGFLTVCMGLIITNYTKLDDITTGVTIAIGLMFVFYLYEIWFCWRGSKIGLSKK